MKVGDIVKIKGSFKKYPVGILISCSNFVDGDWWVILEDDGSLADWPGRHLEVINESR